MSDLDTTEDLRPFEPETYKEQKARVKEEQSGMNYDQIKDSMQSRSQFILEMDRLPSQPHRWIDRGIKMTCENAGHRYHEAFKR